nr:hypothetical protein [uncultured Psychroserpens sp.]
MTNKIKSTLKRINFLETYNDFTNEEILRELLFAKKLQIDKLEKIRSNTSKLVWWLIALPIIIGILIMLLGLGSL